MATQVKVNREVFLRQLESVSPGLSTRDILMQSSCFVFRGGEVLTYNDEVFCRGPSVLDGIVSGAVKADKLRELLRKLPEEELSVETRGNELVITGKARKAGVRMEQEIALPIDDVERPEQWRKLPEEFTEAVAMVQKCASADQSHFEMTCIHLHPDFIEACQPPGTMVTTSDGRVPIGSIRPGQRVWSYSYQSGKAERSIVGANKDCCNQFKHGHLVTRVGQRQYVGDLVVVTAGEKITRYTTDHECLVRLDGAFDKKYVVYVLRRGDQFRVGVTGPRMWKGKWMNPRREGRADVRVRMNAQKADCCWVLACFGTESEALAEERFIVARYGMPDMLFRVRPGESGSQEQCDSFWERFGNNLEGAKSCLRAYGRDPNFPFAERKELSASPRYPGSRPSHMGDVEIKIRACNLMFGMRVLDADKCENGKVTDECWIPFTLSRESYSGPVYSMTVDRAHTYVGDGIVTHNCDNYQLCRWNLRTKISKPVLVRQSSLKHVVPLGVAEFAETGNWIHFRNGEGLVISCRKYAEEYRDLSSILEVEGVVTPFPKQLATAAENAAIFSAENGANDHVRVTLKDGRIDIRGEGVSGWYWEGKKVRYDGAPMEFLIRPALLAQLTKEHEQFQLAPGRLKIDGKRYQYVACLTRPEVHDSENGVAAPRRGGDDKKEEAPSPIKSLRRKKDPKREEEE